MLQRIAYFPKQDRVGDGTTVSADPFTPDGEISGPEKTLAFELEKVLRQRSQIISKPPASPLAGAGLREIEASFYDGLDNEEGFEWRTAEAANESYEGAKSPSEVAAAWLKKARRDRRRLILRNAFGWTLALAVGLAIIAAAALVLLGWRPDIAALVGLLRAG